MQKRNIFFDLDGTLLDSKQRVFRLFKELVPDSSLSFDDYWKLKRQQQDHTFILKQLFEFDEQAIESFKDEWMKKIELECYLDLDTPFDNTGDLILSLAERNKLYVISHRQSVHSALYQLGKWEWSKYFNEIYVTRQVVSKAVLIQENIKTLSASDIFVGDTGEDVKTARILGIKAVAVTSGFLNAERLQSYRPDYIFDNISSIDFDAI